MSHVTQSLGVDIRALVTLITEVQDFPLKGFGNLNFRLQMLAIYIFATVAKVNLDSQKSVHKSITLISYCAFFSHDSNLTTSIVRPYVCTCMHMSILHQNPNHLSQELTFSSINFIHL